MISQEDEERWTPARNGSKQKTKPKKLAPLITIGKYVVYTPWSLRELKAIMGDFPKDVGEI